MKPINMILFSIAAIAMLLCAGCTVQDAGTALTGILSGIGAGLSGL